GRLTWTRLIPLTRSLERPEPITVSVGRLDIRTFAFDAGLALCTRLGPGTACGTVAAGAETHRATLRPEANRVFQLSGDRSTVSPIVSVGGRFELPIAGPFGVFGAIEAVLRPGAPTFEVEDANPTYNLPIFAGAFRAGGWVRFF